MRSRCSHCLSFGLPTVKEIREVTPMAPSLEGGTMSALQCASLVSPSCPTSLEESFHKQRVFANSEPGSFLKMQAHQNRRIRLLGRPHLHRRTASPTAATTISIHPCQYYPYRFVADGLLPSPSSVYTVHPCPRRLSTLETLLYFHRSTCSHISRGTEAYKAYYTDQSQSLNRAVTEGTHFSSRSRAK